VPGRAADTPKAPGTPGTAQQQQQQHHHHAASGSRLQALFAVTRGLLVLLLPRELLLFDTELGAPAASTPCPAGLPPFASLLSVQGSGVCAGAGDEGGTDFLYCVHAGV
jgi:hypothetical protein